MPSSYVMVIAIIITNKYNSRVCVLPHEAKNKLNHLFVH